MRSHQGQIPREHLNVTLVRIPSGQLRRKCNSATRRQDEMTEPIDRQEPDGSPFRERLDGWSLLP